MHKVLRTAERSTERAAWVLDDVWPESASLVAAFFGSGDQLIAPGIFGTWPRRYHWPVHVERLAVLATARRHWLMRRVAKASGAVRQSSYLVQDRNVARELAKGIDYRARHLVVAQVWLPWLDELRVLGGRTFDVVMSRYPLGELHQLLDEAATQIGGSATIADFRAPSELVDHEARLLARARHIYTPHHGIASLFPGQAVQLSWHVPPAKSSRPGDRVAFLGPTIARQRPDMIKSLVAGLGQPLIVFGPELEPLWDGVPTELREKGPNWLDGIGTILHPATVTHEPRALLEARASGVALYATNTCGLNPSDYLPLNRFRSDWLKC
jgi:hypothetical protein